MLEPSIIIAVLSFLSAIIVALIGNNYFRKQKQPCEPDPEQEKLITTLRELVEAQDAKIEHLQETADTSALEIRTLQQQIEELRQVIVSQAILIEELTKSKYPPGIKT